ncbi:hypothetical protein EHV15_34755 [Paenibacillus oralis]|uniref:S-layer homology domain-containing protein n=1 Tax=Paenibacillus oralis TaxID=2490856 RepID=A0A3P3T9P3_9BACL|nr:S-layer homology domain-containing protein [Paenibacillus oralis]RRJ54756.1 hypothetical protein EHV15_34755 [Paenibacillus oralis]
MHSFKKLFSIMLSAALLISSFAGLGSAKASGSQYDVSVKQFTPDNDNFISVRSNSDGSKAIVRGSYYMYLYNDSTSQLEPMSFVGGILANTKDFSKLAYIKSSKTYIYDSNSDTHTEVANFSADFADFSEDGSKLAFSQKSTGFFYYDQSTGVTTQIKPSTVNSGYSNLPADIKSAVGKPIMITPDGSKLILLLYRDSNVLQALYSYDLGTNKMKYLNYRSFPNSWLADGRLFYSTDWNGAYDYYAMDVGTGTSENFNIKSGKSSPYTAPNVKISADGKLYFNGSYFIVRDTGTRLSANKMNEELSREGYIAYYTESKALYRADFSQYVADENKEASDTVTTPSYSQGRVTLSWLPNPSSASLGYTIYRNGTKLSTLNHASLTYTDQTPVRGEVNTYSIEVDGHKTDIQVAVPADTEVAIGNKVTRIGDYVILGSKRFQVFGDNTLIAEPGQFSDLAGPTGTRGGSSDTSVSAITNLSSNFYNGLDDETKKSVTQHKYTLYEKGDTQPYTVVYSYLGLPTATQLQSSELYVAGTWTWTYNSSESALRSINSSGSWGNTTYQTSPVRPILHLNPKANVLWGTGDKIDPLFISGLSDTSALVAPTNVQIKDITSNSATFTWDYAGNAGFELKLNGSVVYSGINKTFTATGLNPSNVYMYSIAATDGSSVSPAVTGNFKTLDGPVKLHAPANFVATDVTETSATLKWDVVEGAESYVLMKDGVQVYSGPSTSYTVMGLSPSTPYRLSLKATATGKEDSSEVLLEVTTKGEEVIPYPSNFTVTDVTYNKVKLAWNLVPGVEGYILQRNGEDIYIGTNLSYEDETVEPETNYVYALKAYKGSKEGLQTVKSVKTPKKPGKAPTESPVLKVTRAYHDKVNLQWTSVTDATYYRIYRNDALVGETTLNVLSDQTVGPESVFLYRVVAGNDYGVTESQIVQVSTPSEPAVIIINPSVPSEGTISWEFKTIPEVDNYYVERNPEWHYFKNPDGTFHVSYKNEATGETKDLGNVEEVNGKLPFTESGIIPGQDYHYDILAVVKNPDGSDTVVGQTPVDVTTPNDGSGVTVPGPGDDGSTPTDPDNGGSTPTDPGKGGNTPDDGTGSGGSDGGSSGDGSNNTGSGGSGGSSGGGSSNGGTSNAGTTAPSTENPSTGDSPLEEGQSSGDIPAGVNDQTGETPIEFTDVIPEYAKDAVDYLSAKGIIKGRADGSFEADAQVTRVEFAIMLVRSLGKESSVGYQGGFIDVDTSAWYAKELAAGLNTGVTKGFTDGTYRPNAIIPREQAAIMVANVLDYKDPTKYDFTDYSRIIEWAKESVNIVANAGIMTGELDGFFNPKKPMTRAEAAVVIYRLLHN